MAKRQQIFIESRSGNKRIERAIPQFMKRFGMARDQATAVAIRLESVGRLQVSGAPTPTAKRGVKVPPAAVLAALKAMKKDRTPERTVYRDGEKFVVSDPFVARKKISRKKRKPKRK